MVNEMSQNQSCKPEVFTCVMRTLDPVHVGTGGSRLGRVDNTIVRDPVTRVPKIPGSSLAGVLRAYVAMQNGKYQTCAGQGVADQSDGSGHCGKSNCPVCTIFGFAKGKDQQGGGFAGLAAFSDMHVLLFPVATFKGPRWVTSPMVLETIGCRCELDDENAYYPLNDEESAARLNFGWLYLKKGVDFDKDSIEQSVRKYLCCSGNGGDNGCDLDDIIKNIVVVSNKLFSHIVNSNLEVRTSVSIDPATGTAQEGALFTYEALPRDTFMFWVLTCKDPQCFKINGNVPKKVNGSNMDITYVGETVKKGTEYLEFLGIGGMGTRGMGRMACVCFN